MILALVAAKAIRSSSVRKALRNIVSTAFEVPNGALALGSTSAAFAFSLSLSFLADSLMVSLVSFLIDSWNDFSVISNCAFFFFFFFFFFSLSSLSFSKLAFSKSPFSKSSFSKSSLPRLPLPKPFFSTFKASLSLTNSFIEFSKSSIFKDFLNSAFEVSIETSYAESDKSISMPWFKLLFTSISKQEFGFLSECVLKSSTGVFFTISFNGHLLFNKMCKTTAHH